MRSRGVKPSMTVLKMWTSRRNARNVSVMDKINEGMSRWFGHVTKAGVLRQYIERKKMVEEIGNAQRRSGTIM